MSLRRLFVYVVMVGAFGALVGCGSAATDPDYIDPAAEQAYSDYQAEQAAQDLRADRFDQGYSDYLQDRYGQYDNYGNDYESPDYSGGYDNYGNDYGSPDYSGGGVGSQAYSGGGVGASACPNGCSVPPQGCLIKGNISFDTGEWIYHVPGQEFYSQTVINPDYGERWFCTEAEALANGWRRSRR